MGSLKVDLKISLFAIWRKRRPAFHHFAQARGCLGCIRTCLDYFGTLWGATLSRNWRDHLWHRLWVGKVVLDPPFRRLRHGTSDLRSRLRKQVLIFCCWLHLFSYLVSFVIRSAPIPKTPPVHLHPQLQSSNYGRNCRKTLPHFEISSTTYFRQMPSLKQPVLVQVGEQP